jgi:hypothetical protein
MFGPAMTRFWRGMREPWELMGRMRHDRALWARYWRTVLVQAALTLVAGLAVFWVGKQGADAWNDAFGPDEPLEATAPATSGPPGATATAPVAPAERSTSATGNSASPAGESPAPPGPTDPARVPGAPPTPAAHAGHPARKGGQAAPSDTGSAASRASESDEDDDETDKDAVAEEDSDDEDKATDELGKKIEALVTSSSSERGQRTTELKQQIQALVKASQEKRGKRNAELNKKIEGLVNAPPEERGKRIAELVNAEVEKSKREGVVDERRALTDTLDELATKSEELAREAPTNRGEARRTRLRLERKLKAAQKDAERLVSRGAAPLSADERARIDRTRAALYRARRQEGGLVGRLGAVLALLTVIYASLGIAQTGILALSRDFHDVLSRDLSLLVNVAPEDPPMRPKVRLDVPWVRRKANRRAQFFMGFLPGTVLIYIVTRFVPHFRAEVTSVLTAVWAAYWWMVMTAGQSARAWSPPETTPRPWYLRAWFSLGDRFFLFRWGPFRWWGRVWERFARRFYGPSERVEEQPLEFAGLGLSRAVLLIPVLKMLFRPVFPVCAARLLVEHAATARLPVPVTSAEVAAAAERAPDAEARAHSGVATTG